MIVELFSGGGLGLLVGTLLGLSVSQVVGGVVAALAALLGGFLGLQATPQDSGRALRTGAFGGFCVIGLMLGLAVRSGSLLAPSIKAEVAAWTDAGYEPAQARAFVALARLGVQPKDTTLAPGASIEAAVSAHSNTLFAAKAKSVCNDVDGLSTMDDKLASLRSHGGQFAAIAQTISQEADKQAALARELKPLCD